MTEAVRPTKAQLATLRRLAAGETLYRSQVYGVTVGNRWMVWRWNDVDRAVTDDFVLRMEKAGWVERDDDPDWDGGTEVVKITAAGRAFCKPKEGEEVRG